MQVTKVPVWFETSSTVLAWLVARETKDSADVTVITASLASSEGDEHYLVLYVDDLLIAGRNIRTIEKLRNRFPVEFEMMDCGDARFFLSGFAIQNSYRRSGTRELPNIQKNGYKF